MELELEMQMDGWHVIKQGISKQSVHVRASACIGSLRPIPFQAYGISSVVFATATKEQRMPCRASGACGVSGPVRFVLVTKAALQLTRRPGRCRPYLFVSAGLAYQGSSLVSRSVSVSRGKIPVKTKSF